MAREVIAMAEEIDYLREQNMRLAEYEQKYHELLGDSLAHSQTMVGNTIKMLLVPGVAEAFKANATREPLP